MTPCEPGEGGVVVRGEKIGEHEEHGAPAQRRLESASAAPTSVPVPAGSKASRSLITRSDVSAALRRLRRTRSTPVGEETAPTRSLLRAAARASTAHTSTARSRLGAPERAEAAGRAVVHHEQDSELPLLEVAFDVRRAQPGGDVPVDRRARRRPAGTPAPRRTRLPAPGTRSSIRRPRCRGRRWRVVISIRRTSRRPRRGSRHRHRPRIRSRSASGPTPSASAR